MSVGRVSGEEEQASKLICEKIMPFDDGQKRALDPVRGSGSLSGTGSRNCCTLLRQSDGKDSVVIYRGEAESHEASAAC